MGLGAPRSSGARIPSEAVRSVERASGASEAALVTTKEVLVIIDFLVNYDFLGSP